MKIHRLIFNDDSTTALRDVTFGVGMFTERQVSAVPEPCSNLALGAGEPRTSGATGRRPRHIR